jgi:hypothetical protein
MELQTRNETVAELKSANKKLTIGIICLAITVVCLAVKLVFQSEILLVMTPGMPANSVIERTSFDKPAQMATLNAITSNLGQINPANAAYQKQFLQLYFAPEAYTAITSEIDLKVEKARLERELGSSYFVFKRYEYDPDIDRHFVLGEQHTVNAAKDTAQDYVYEYAIRIENYRLWVTEVKSYPGDRPHNKAWIEANKK